MKARQALVVVDLQRDFCPGGALPVRRGDEIVKPINELIRKFQSGNLPVLLTRDWHPKDHCSFKAQGGIWPPHAVRGTPGAQFPPYLQVPRSATIVSKATRRDAEAYSGFQGTDLAARLKSLGVGELFIAGLATDYCIKNTVIDAIGEGFRVYLVTDCVKGVNLKRTDSATAFREMIARGARVVTSRQLTRSLRGRVAVWSSS